MSSRLSSLLVQDGLVSAQKVAEAFGRQVIHGGALDSCLIELKALDEDELLSYLGRAAGLPTQPRGIHAGELPRADVLEVFSREVAERFRAVPTQLLAGGVLRVLVPDGVDLGEMDNLALTVQQRIEPWIVLEARFVEAMDKVYGAGVPSRFARLLQRSDKAHQTKSWPAPRLIDPLPRFGSLATLRLVPAPPPAPEPVVKPVEPVAPPVAAPPAEPVAAPAVVQAVEPVAPTGVAPVEPVAPPVEPVRPEAPAVAAPVEPVAPPVAAPVEPARPEPPAVAAPVEPVGEVRPAVAPVEPAPTSAAAAKAPEEDTKGTAALKAPEEQPAAPVPTPSAPAVVERAPEAAPLPVAAAAPTAAPSQPPVAPSAEAKPSAAVPELEPTVIVDPRRFGVEKSGPAISSPTASNRRDTPSRVPVVVEQSSGISADGIDALSMDDWLSAVNWLTGPSGKTPPPSTRTPVPAAKPSEAPAAAEPTPASTAPAAPTATQPAAPAEPTPTPEVQVPAQATQPAAATPEPTPGVPVAPPVATPPSTASPPGRKRRRGKEVQPTKPAVAATKPQAAAPTGKPVPPSGKPATQAVAQPAGKPAQAATPISKPAVTPVQKPVQPVQPVATRSQPSKPVQPARPSTPVVTPVASVAPVAHAATPTLAEPPVEPRPVEPRPVEPIPAVAPIATAPLPAAAAEPESARTPETGPPAFEEPIAAPPVPEPVPEPINSGRLGERIVEDLGPTPKRPVEPVKPAARPEPVVAKPEARPTAKPEPAPVAKVAARPEAKPESKTEAKPESKTEARPESKTEAKPESKTEAKPESKTEARPETKTEAKQAAKPESAAKLAAKPETRPEPAAKPETRPEPAAKPETRPEPAAKPETRPEPAAKPEGRTEAKPVQEEPALSEAPPPSAESPVPVLRPRPRVVQALSEPGSAPLSLEAAREIISAAADRDTVFEALCRGLRGRVGFAAVLTVHGDVAFGRVALQDTWLERDKLGRISVNLDRGSPFRQAIRSRAPIAGRVGEQAASSDPLRALGRRPPLPGAVLPILVRGKPVALVYVDDDGSELPGELLDDSRPLLAEAGQALQRLSLKGKTGGLATSDVGGQVTAEHATTGTSSYRAPSQKSPGEQAAPAAVSPVPAVIPAAIPSAIQEQPTTPLRVGAADKGKARSPVPAAVTASVTDSPTPLPTPLPPEVTAPMGLKPPAPPADKTVPISVGGKPLPGPAAEQVPAGWSALVESAAKGDAQAAAKLLGGGVEAARAVVAALPGPLRKEERHALGDPSGGPVFSRGPLLGLVLRLGAAAITPLLERLKDPSTTAEVRYYIALCFAEAPVLAAIAPLGEQLFDKDETVRTAAVTALRSFAPGPELLALVSRLRDEVDGGDATRVRYAVDALGELRVVAAVPQLINLLDSDEPALVDALGRALQSITKQDFGRSRVRWAAWWRRHQEQPRLQWLLDGLANPSAMLRSAAQEELAALCGDVVGYRFDQPRRERDVLRRRWVEWWQRRGFPVE
ncbi:MAG: hypothetical protein U1A78_29375 [Polyangia bacterium]